MNKETEVNDLIHEPTEQCRRCKSRFTKDDITIDNLCLGCSDDLDYLADMQRKRILEED